LSPDVIHRGASTRAAARFFVGIERRHMVIGDFGFPSSHAFRTP
jgi:hypothetical protein